MTMNEEPNEVSNCRKSSLYLSDHGHVDEKADDAADGCYHLSPQGAQGRFRG